MVDVRVLRLSLALAYFAAATSYAADADRQYATDVAANPAWYNQNRQTNNPAAQSQTAQHQPKQTSFPVTLDGPITIQKSDKDRDAETKEGEHKASSERELINWTAGLVLVTAILAMITGVLARYTYKLWDDASRTSRIQRVATRRALRTAKQSAVAATRATEIAVRTEAPYLLPRVIKWGSLYPKESVAADAVHRPTATLVFDNIGRTPAILLRVGAKLVLMDGPKRPDVLPIESIPRILRTEAIAPTKYGGSKDWTMDRTVDAVEISKLQAEVESKDYARIYFVGYVIYEDVFNVRTTARFCIKVRRGWQTTAGGKRHNSMEREDGPDDESEEQADTDV